MFYLENMLSMFSGTFFLQALYAEFEDAMYQTVESGGALDAEALSDLWTELYQEYRGDTIESFPDSRYGWASIPHFYYNYYVYQYATSVAYAASICERITSGEERAVEDYLAFLKLGGVGVSGGTACHRGCRSAGRGNLSACAGFLQRDGRRV